MLSHSYIWNNGSNNSDFETAGNWLDATGAPTSEVPGADDTVYFLATEYVSGTGTVASLASNGTGPYGLVLAATMDDTNTATFAGTNWISGGSLIVGAPINSGSYEPDIYIGGNGATGTLNILATSSLVGIDPNADIVPVIYLGSGGGEGTLNVVGSGAIVTNAIINIADGSMLVANGASVQTEGGVINVGGFGGSGTLTITGQSSVDTTTPDNSRSDYVLVGDGSSGTGTLDVSGYSTLTTDSLQIGNTLSGDPPAIGVLNLALATIDVHAGFRVDADSTANLSLGGYLFANDSSAIYGALSLTGLYTDFEENGSLAIYGTATVANNALLYCTEAQDPGSSGILLAPDSGGANAVLSVTTGGKVFTGQGLDIGTNAPAEGAATLNITDGGEVEVSAVNQTSYVGGTGGGTGEINLSGTSSLLFMKSGQLDVGYAGVGIINVQSGATFDAPVCDFENGSFVSINGPGASFIASEVIALAGSSITVSGGATFSAATNLISIGDISLLGGTMDGLGIKVEGFLSGFGTITAATLGLSGEVSALNGTLTIHASVTGTGVLQVDTGATLDLTGAGGITSSLAFFASATANVGSAATLRDVISGWQVGDVLNLAGLDATRETYNAGTLTLTGQGGTSLETLVFAGNYDLGNFAISTSGTTGTTITFHS
jgi:T5SS/PEP-CTERM-associated repeat protein